VNRLYKIVLIWLLLPAIPLQGIAAGMQISCGPMHHASDRASLAPQHDGGGGDEHQHHHHGMSQHDDGTQHDDSAGKGKMQRADTCSACAACCVGAAVIPSTLQIPLASSAVGARIAEPSSSFTGHIPAGLERPPRFILS
jgi:hypothetical protein